jgi:hypothetical protein
MKKNRLLTALAIAAAMSSSAIADENNAYVQTGIISAHYSNPYFAFTNSLVALTIGKNINENLSVEVMGAGAINEAYGYWGNTYITAKVSSAVGAYVKARTTPSNGISLYAKAGMTRGTVTLSAYAPGYTASAWATATSPSAGAGIQVDTSDRSNVTFDYMSYYSKNNVKISGPSVTFGFNF